MEEMILEIIDNEYQSLRALRNFLKENYMKILPSKDLYSYLDTENIEELVEEDIYYIDDVIATIKKNRNDKFYIVFEIEE